MMSCTPASSKAGPSAPATHFTNNSKDSSLIYCQSQLVTVDVERVLYEGPNPDYFYIKVEIKNITDNTIGIDLSDKWKIIYPNQWGNLNEPQRNTIDEIRVVPDKLDRAKKVRLLTGYKNHTLEFIKPHSTFTYYTEFNANGKKGIEETKETGDYLFLSLDGQLFITDGKKCERIAFEEGTHWKGNSIFTKPIAWNIIEDETLIIERK